LQGESNKKGVKNQIIEPPSDHSYEALYSENYRLREALTKATQFTKADQSSTNEIEFTIPKEKYEHVKAAMDNSTNSLLLLQIHPIHITYIFEYYFFFKSYTE
jgi:hypothetical protein